MDNIVTKNPLDKEGFIETIIETYINYNYMSNILANISLKKATSESIIYREVFYKTIFEEWQNYIINYDVTSLPKEQQKEINLLKEYLKKIKIKNGKDALNYSDPNNIENEDLKKALEKYNWKSTKDNYYRVSSIPIDNDQKENYIYNLYINCDNNKLHQILLEFIKKCKEQNLDYYVEYNEKEHRDDILIIKSNKSNLEKYISILNEIIKNNNLEKNISDVPFFSSPINNKIGCTVNSDSNKAFVERRVNHITECIKEETISYIINDLYKEVTLPSGRKLLYKEFLIKNLVDIIRKKIITNQENKNYGKPSREFLYLLEIEISKNFNTIMNSLCSSNKNIKIELQINKTRVTITYNDIQTLLKNQMIYMNRIHKNYKKDLLKRIKNTSKNYDIDPDNYAFDLINNKKTTDKTSMYKITDLSPTDNIENKESYKSSKQEKKEGIILESNHKRRSIEQLIEDINNKSSKS